MQYTKMKSEHEPYNDGFLEVGSIVPKYNNAKKRIGEEFKLIERLAFRNMSKRDNDYTFAQAFGYTLDKKVKIPYRKISSNNKIKINEEIYDIYKIDEDFPSIFIYLQRVVVKDER